MNKKTILIVDDSDLDRTLFSRAFSGLGNFLIKEASNGEQCLDVIAQGNIDLVLLDILMPGTHGTEILKKIRETMNPIALPVIMVTSKNDDVYVVDCFKSGANDYIQKPVNFDVAISRITTHLRLSEYSEKMSILREITALNAMITTYNHEINNALAVAIGSFSLLKIDPENTKAKNLKDSLWRIADVVKKIKATNEKQAVEFEQYSSQNKMIKVK